MTNLPSDQEFEKRAAARLLDVLIKAGLLAVLAMLCYTIFAPFLPLMAWALVLAVTLYPLHRAIARKIGGRQGLAATLLVLLGCLLLIAPTALLLNSFGTSVLGFVESVRTNTLQVPEPRDSVRTWPVVGERVHAFWTSAHDDLPKLIESLQPKIGNLAKKAVSIVAGIGVTVLKFLAALIVAGILMAYGEAGARGAKSIFERIMGYERGGNFATLATATIRAVAQGVIGIAFVQAILVGLCLLVAGVPFAGVLAVITLVLSIAQIPALIVVLPAIGYIWSSGKYETGMAVLYTVLLLLSSLADNVLKPLMLGRGVDAPMPVILIGALGGMAAGGILGMFVGATLLAIGYQLFMAWVAANPEAKPAAKVAGSGAKSG